MREVTDPAVLQQLNGGSQDPNATIIDMFGSKEVTDPALLQQLNGQAGAAGSQPAPAPSYGAGLVGKYMGSQPQGPSVASDVGKAVGSNLVGGGLDLAMTLPNLLNQAVAGPQMVYRGMTGREHDNSPLYQPFYGSGDVEKMLGTDYQPQTTAGKVAALPARIAGGIGMAKNIESGGAAWDARLASEEPRQGMLASKSSDPMAAPTYQASTQDLKDIAQQSYGTADKVGGALNAAAVTRAVEKAHAVAGKQSEEGLDFSGENPVSKALSDLSRRAGKPMSLRGAQEIDDDLGDRIGAAFRSGNNDTATKLMDIRNTLREAYQGAAPEDMANKTGFDAWRNGDKLWSAYRHSSDVEKIIEQGKMADVPSTAIKNGFKALSKSKQFNTYTATEQAAIKHAAHTGIVTGALKTVGGKLISGVAGATGGALGGGIPGAMIGAAAGEAMGYPMRLGATALQTRRGNAVMDEILNRQAVQDALKQAATKR